MAEVANLPKAPEHSSASTITVAADIPNEIIQNEVLDTSFGGQLGTSPNQEKSCNSHHHDSEYDTASDLEGGGHDEYDDEDDIDEEENEDDSLEDAENTDSDSVELEGGHQQTDIQEQEQTDYKKKVDEDRSNPQYIPKKGTFYEHDDRTTDEANCRQSQATDSTEASVKKSASPTTTSQDSKTVKKWQPASGVDRWSHDRFDVNEQAPKSRAELVSAYGYDIRTEDGPPRARRRRRYARGPSKYSRNWEDETAYIKATGSIKKPPKPEEFPALEERQRNRKTRSYRDEKENRIERQNSDRIRNGGQNRENKEQIRRSRNSKVFRPGGRLSGMEFKNKNRPTANNTKGTLNCANVNNNVENEPSNAKSFTSNQPAEVNVPDTNFKKIPNAYKNMQTPIKVNQQSYNGFESNQSLHQTPQSVNSVIGTSYSHREVGEKSANDGNSNNSQNRTPINTSSSQLSARLQQAQNRNDPSHVGSVQMHTLANQHNAHVSNTISNPIIELQQQQQTNHQEPARSKRYSSLRQRSQHETVGGVPSSQHLDQHALQQLHLQHEVQQQQQQMASNIHPPQQIMLQEQHLIQANLMQLYHQENLQAQMQALQVSGLPQATVPQPPAPGKQPYTTMQQQYTAPPTGPPATAYYTATTPDYSNPPPTAGPPQPQYTQTAAFLQTQSAGTPLTFNPNGPQPLNQSTISPSIATPSSTPVAPAAVNYVQTGSQNPPTAPTPAYSNYTNYQNFNTVGGTTYFVPTPQTSTRPAVLPQRRPTNAIPILPPIEKTKRVQDNKEEESKTNSSTSGLGAASTTAPPIGSAENIDHILDNMFVQRPPYQPQTRKSSSPPTEDNNKVSTGGNANPQGDLTVARTSEGAYNNAAPLEVEATNKPIPPPEVNNQNISTSTVTDADSGSTSHFESTGNKSGPQ